MRSFHRMHFFLFKGLGYSFIRGWAVFCLQQESRQQHERTLLDFPFRTCSERKKRMDESTVTDHAPAHLEGGGTTAAPTPRRSSTPARHASLEDSEARAATGAVGGGSGGGGEGSTPSTASAPPPLVAQPPPAPEPVVVEGPVQVGSPRHHFIYLYCLPPCAPAGLIPSTCRARGPAR